MNKTESVLFTKLLDKVEEIGETVATVEEHIRNQNGKVDKNTAVSLENRDWIIGMNGSMKILSILVPIVSAVASFIIIKIVGG